MTTLTLSSLGHTWILDLDGSLVKHNGYKTDGRDTLLEGAEEFLRGIPGVDMIVFLTSRTLEYKEMTENFLAARGIRHDHIIYGAPLGERILVNDRKPSGLDTAFAINAERDEPVAIRLGVDEGL
jgi:hypothetical protein